MYESEDGCKHCVLCVGTHKFTFDRTDAIYVVFHSCGLYDIPWISIADVSLFQALAAILEYVTHLPRCQASIYPILLVDFQQNCAQYFPETLNVRTILQTGLIFVVILIKQQNSDEKVHLFPLVLDCPRYILNHLRLMLLKYYLQEGHFGISLQECGNLPVSSC